MGHVAPLLERPPKLVAYIIPPGADGMGSWPATLIVVDTAYPKEPETVGEWPLHHPQTNQGRRTVNVGGLQAAAADQLNRSGYRPPGRNRGFHWTSIPRRPDSPFAATAPRWSADCERDPEPAP